MSTQEHNAAITDLLPDTIIELYEVELSSIDGIRRFHAGKIVDKDIVLDGNTYFSIPIEADGFESKGDGTLPRPKLLVGNPDGVISDIMKRRDDMVGRHFKRIRIFLKYIDAENFPDNVNPFAVSDPTARFDDDFYVFNRKVTENKYFIEFELISPLEVESHTLPGRLMIAGYCPWRYRGIGCKYGCRHDSTGPTLNVVDPYGKKDEEGSTLIKNSTFFRREDDIAKVEPTPLGVPVADQNNKRFDTYENGYGLKTMQWVYDYTNAFTSITTTSSAADGATSLAVSAITEHVSPNRTITLYESGSKVGVFKLDTMVEGEITSVTSLSGALSMDTKGATLVSGATGIAGYVKGDVTRIPGGETGIIDKQENVKTVGTRSSEPPGFFVCIQDHTAVQDPRYKKEYWIEDQCAKNLSACQMRFGEYALGLPFGGFPSIEAYRYTN